MADTNFPHRRYNPLTEDWVLVSPQRTQRPWKGQVEEIPEADLPEYDPDCYLCPGNLRAEGQRNPSYSSTHVFDNDYPALLSVNLAVPSRRRNQDHNFSLTAGEILADASVRGLFVNEPESGICRVVCFSPRHDLSLPELSTSQISDVIRTWVDQTLDLKAQESIRYVQVFENKGALMGASNPHPHCQVWATKHIPNEPAKELSSQLKYIARNGNCLLCDYLQVEQESNERIVIENDDFTALVPYWSIWPFEVMILSRRHIASLTELSPAEVEALADIMRQLTIRYDNLFEISFPYSMGFHQAPVNDSTHPEWHLHAHYYPPLLRSATVRKFMVGYEMLASPQRDLTPEHAAERLRAMNDVHFRRSS
jgi:UDPglucose--hexose-1-phosphate uridylyltransferase